MPSGPQLTVSQFGNSCCPNPECLDVAILLLVDSHGAAYDDSTFCGSLVVYLVDWLAHFDCLTGIDRLLVIGWWSSCQRPTALYSASGNRDFPFANGPLNFSTPGPKSVVPACPTCPFRTASNWSSAYCSSMEMRILGTNSILMAHPPPL